MIETSSPDQTEAIEHRWPAWSCPLHGRPLEEAGEALLCPEGHEYEIRRGIPRFVPPSSYADGFGAQWNTYRTSQLDSETGVPITRDRARRCVGDEIWENLPGLVVLECGCGAGRFTEVLLSRGARVTSVDLSSAVEANDANFPQDGTHRVAQADILHLPFAPQQYELVFCLGVVQHTPVPELTIARLYDQVRPGGHLVFDHYAHTLSTYTKLEYFYRQWVMRLPAEKSIAVTQRMVDLLLPLHRIGRVSSIGQALLSRISPVRAYYHTYPELDEETQREWAMVDTHDALARRYSRMRTRGQIRTTLEQLGATDIVCEIGGNGIEARCRRPS